jgi:hypothetical protein
VPSDVGKPFAIGFIVLRRLRRFVRQASAERGIFLFGRWVRSPCSSTTVGVSNMIDFIGHIHTPGKYDAQPSPR